MSDSKRKARSVGRNLPGPRKGHLDGQLALTRALPSVLGGLAKPSTGYTFSTPPGTLVPAAASSLPFQVPSNIVNTFREPGLPGVPSRTQGRRRGEEAPARGSGGRREPAPGEEGLREGSGRRRREPRVSSPR